MSDAKQVKFLSHEEELQLMRRWKTHRDSRALGKVMAAMLPMLRKLARTFRGLGEDLEELLSAGYLGLVEAANRFDPERGFRFATYALVWAKGAMQVASNRKFSTEPYEEERPGELETSGEGETIALSDRSRLSRILDEAMSTLSERERLILGGRFLQDEALTFAELTPSFGVSKERARQLESSALQRLRKAFARRGISREILFEN